MHTSELGFLGRHAPFDRMDAAHLEWMLARLALSYFSSGEVILAPEQGTAERFLIVKQGHVHGESEATTAGEEARMELAAGECFPLGALLARRPISSVYRAKDDVFCYELAEADFQALLDMSPPFRDFCTRRIANLLEYSRLSLQASYGQQALERQSLLSPLSAVMRTPVVTCTPETPLGTALNIMREKRIGSMIAADDTGHPLGIMTLHDVLERVAIPQADATQPVIDVMSRNLAILPPSALAHEAALMMARQGIRHLLVVESGVLQGVVSEKDLFALQRTGLHRIGADIRHATDLDALRRAAAGIRDMVHAMLAQGIAPEHLMQLIATFNDQLTVRIIEQEYERAGMGQSPLQGRLCWLALGSEGRLEQTLNTDQDNALLFLPPPDMTEDEARAQLLPVAKRINDALAACGFPLCSGGIMASNPAWCLSLQEWQRTFSGWIDAGAPQDLLHASIFFDFRSLHGNVELADELRAWLMPKVAANTRFQYQMAVNALRNRPPLGVVRDFAVNESHTLDLKVNGITPFVDAARIFSLAAGVTQTQTLQRLRASAEKLHFSSEDVEAWADALLFIQTLRMRHHDEVVAQGGEGTELDNRIDPESLKALDRRILKEAFRQARKLQRRLALEYQL